MNTLSVPSTYRPNAQAKPPPTAATVFGIPEYLQAVGGRLERLVGQGWADEFRAFANLILRTDRLMSGTD